jgi:hypothetical protein
VHPPCPHCDQPDVSLLRLVLIEEILRAEEPLLELLAEVLQACGLCPLGDAGEAPAAGRVRPRQGTPPARRHAGAEDA